MTMDAMRERLQVPKELVQEICADVMVGTYGIQGSLKRARMEVTRRIEEWIDAALAATPEPVAYSLAGEIEVEISKIIGDFEEGKFRIPIVRLLDKHIAILQSEIAKARLDALEEAAKSVDEWNDSIKNGDLVIDQKHIRAALGVASHSIRALAKGGAA